MKILFLDIDGVLNLYEESYDEFGPCFHESFVSNLKFIIDETNAKIVVSSSWRKDGLEKIQAMWKFRQLPGEVIDVTPTLKLQKNGSIIFYNDKLIRHPTERVNGYSIPRGCEIEYWLNDTKATITQYVIIDDDTDMLFKQRNNYVQCSGNFSHTDNLEGYGLTLECAQQAINILNN